MRYVLKRIYGIINPQSLKICLDNAGACCSLTCVVKADRRTEGSHTEPKYQALIIKSGQWVVGSVEWVGEPD